MRRILGARRRHGWQLLMASILGCSHTAPFATETQGALGPFHPGNPALVSVSPGSWTQDGRGILIQGKCLDSSLAEAEKSAFRILPVVGGSAIWEFCELRPWVAGSPDSTWRFVAPAISRDGLLLYVEGIGRLSTPTRPWPFPVNWHAELWLADTNSVRALARRQLLVLYRDSVGIPVVPPTAINWIAEMAWVGSSDFIARAQYLAPNATVTEFGLAHGVITPNGATLATIPGTAFVQSFAVAQAGTTIAFTGDSFNISRVAVAGGPVTLVATFANSAVRRVVDISCRDELCIVLTTDPTPANLPRSTLWRLTLSNGQLLPIQSFQAIFGSAKLSPVSGDVLMFGPGGLSLYTNLVP